jgi:hypothetical protein
MQVIVTPAFKLALAANGVASPAALGVLFGAKMDLCKVDAPLSPTIPLATLTAGIANFTGYAQGTVTWDAPSVAGDNTVEVVGNMPLWRPSDAVTPNVIFDWFMTAAVGGALLMMARFDGAPLPMGTALNQIQLVMRWRPSDNSIAVAFN